MSYTDWLGNPIEVGSPVLYAISDSHFAKVVWGEVLEVIPVDDGPYAESYGRTFKLKIQPYYENTDVVGPGRPGRGASYKAEYSAGNWESEDPAKRPKLLSVKYERIKAKPVMIQNVEKVTVFPLSLPIRERLDAIQDEAIRRSNERIARNR